MGDDSDPITFASPPRPSTSQTHLLTNPSPCTPKTFQTPPFSQTITSQTSSPLRSNPSILREIRIPALPGSLRHDILSHFPHLSSVTQREQVWERTTHSQESLVTASTQHRTSHPDTQGLCPYCGIPCQCWPEAVAVPSSFSKWKFLFWSPQEPPTVHCCNSEDGKAMEPIPQSAAES